MASTDTDPRKAARGAAPRRRPPARHQVQRVKARANYDRAAVHAILDAACIAHVAFCVGTQPFVIPMLYARDGDALLLHGSVASRLQHALADGIEACVGVTLLDGFVLARSHFHHSMNYRSVVAFGRAHMVTDADGKAAALAGFVDAILPGRAAESRPADRKELAATALLRFAIVDASAKVRAGGPKDEAADLALPYWAGVVPVAVCAGEAQADAHVADDTPLPASVRRLLATTARA
jgi:nitroimidazol reductase NimA-like FMN-containing flavoprotein (pyridoxamine 5'-phosphate oxidase superfamily)